MTLVVVRFVMVYLLILLLVEKIGHETHKQNINTKQENLRNKYLNKYFFHY